MIIRVLDALEASGMVKAIVICGPPKHVLPDCPELEERIESGRVTWVPNLDSPSRSANSALAQIDPAGSCIADDGRSCLIDTLNSAVFFKPNRKWRAADATVGVVKHEDVVAAFPGAKRTVIRLRDGGFCGCNLYAFLNPRGRGLVSFWQRAEDLRKRPWLLIAQTFGPHGWFSFICWDCCQSIRG